MSVWGIRTGWRFEASEITRETAKCVFYIPEWRARRETRCDKSGFLDWRGTEEAARLLVEQLNSAQAERERRTRAARDWFTARQAELLRDSGSGPSGRRLEQAPGEAPHSGLSDSEGIAQPLSES